MNSIKIQSVGVHVVGIVAGLGMVVAAFAQNLDNSKTAVSAGAGTVLALGSIVAKLFHDKGVNVATIQNAGSDFAAALPSLTSDLTSVKTFIENEWPASKAVLTEATGKVGALETRVAAIPGLPQIVQAVKDNFFVAPATSPNPVVVPVAAPAPVVTPVEGGAG